MVKRLQVHLNMRQNSGGFHIVVLLYVSFNVLIYYYQTLIILVSQAHLIGVLVIIKLFFIQKIKFKHPNINFMGRSYKNYNKEHF